MICSTTPSAWCSKPNAAACSLLQRRLTIGYSRASRLIEAMAAAGIVGDYKGSQAREATLTLEEWDAMKAQAQTDAESGMSV